MKLTKLLERLDYKVVAGSDNIEITELVNDSRKVVPGSVFVCISGAVSDGHQYVKDVAERGAAAVIDRYQSRKYKIRTGTYVSSLLRISG